VHAVTLPLWVGWVGDQERIERGRERRVSRIVFLFRRLAVISSIRGNSRDSRICTPPVNKHRAMLFASVHAFHRCIFHARARAHVLPFCSWHGEPEKRG